MIIGIFLSDFPNGLKIGSRVRGLYERNRGENYEATFLVLREASLNEWLQYRKENKLDIIKDYTRNDARFYQVHTD